MFSPSVTHILFEQLTLAPRRIYTDGRAWPKIEEPTFAGYSIGKWVDTDGDGRFDELQVETRHVRGPRTWDQSGMPMADDDEGVIKERLFLAKDNPNLINNEITTIDNSLTRPWTTMRGYRRVKNAKEATWVENNCTEGQAHVTIGGESYFLSGDGTIMPMRKDQPPPDLKYFISGRSSAARNHSCFSASFRWLFSANTFAQRTLSLRMKASNSAGVLLLGEMPTFSRRSIIAGSA